MKAQWQGSIKTGYGTVFNSVGHIAVVGGQPKPLVEGVIDRMR